jgi:hypothetical protein
MNKRERREQYLSTRRPAEFFEKRKQFNMDRPITIDDIKTILSLHPIGCVFELDAPQKILDRLGNTKTQEEWHENETSLKQFREIFTSVEMYCPWEGINRLSEYGITDLQWTE